MASLIDGLRESHGISVAALNSLSENKADFIFEDFIKQTMGGGDKVQDWDRHSIYRLVVFRSSVPARYRLRYMLGNLNVIRS